MPTKSLQQRTGHYRFDWPLNGKLRTDVDGMLIGENNFQRLDNFRYTADSIAGVLGMTKFNATPIDLLTLQNGYHYKKSQPEETHIFVQAKTGASSKLYKSGNTAAIPLQDTFSSIATLEDNKTIFFSETPNSGVAALNGTSNRVWEGLEGTCANFINHDPAESFWYDYTSKVQNTRTDAQNVAIIHSIGGVAYVYVGAVRPLQGVKFYVSTANTATAAATGYVWTGSSFTSLTITDGTASGGKTLAVTGSITFPSTAATAKVSAIRKGIAYWYKFVFTGISATTAVSHCTVDSPMLPITDLWDGTARTCVQCWVENNPSATKTDQTIGIAPSTTDNPKVYTASNPYSYGDFGVNTSAYSSKLYFGFSERQMGLDVSLPDFNYVNGGSNTAITVYYWNGAAWTSVGAVSDGTASGSISFKHTGTITWNPIDENIEFKTQISNTNQWYYYKIVFGDGNVHIAESVRCDSLTGITAPCQVNPYRFSVLWQNRLWLLNDMTDKKNSGRCSAYGTNSVFNGPDSVEREFGGASELTCGETIFSRYGNSLYDNMILFKRDAIYLIDGNSPSNWTKYTISETVGCVAPLTLKRCDMSYEVAPGQSKHVLLFRSGRGIEFFDGNTLVPVSGDIQSFFNPASSDYVNPVTYDTSVETAFYDEKNYEYHWCFTNASGKQEWVYSLMYRKWSKFLRGTGKDLVCGFTIQDTAGNPYSMGGTADGFIERLEYGTTMDGNAIVSTFRNGDIFLLKSGAYACKMRRLKLFGKTKNTSTAKVTMKHYANTATTGVSLPDIVQTGATSRIYQAKCSVNIDATLHSIECGISTTNETIGFEPMMISGLYEMVREDF